MRWFSAIILASTLLLGPGFAVAQTLDDNRSDLADRNDGFNPGWVGLLGLAGLLGLRGKTEATFRAEPKTATVRP